MADQSIKQDTLTLSSILEYVSSVEYPAWKEDFVIAAEDSRAPDTVISLLEQLPDNEYGKEEEFKEAITEIVQPA